MSEARPQRVPIEPGFFTIPDDPDQPPRLLGSRCGSCGEHFFPRRPVCAKCLARGTEDVELSTRSTLYTWTYVHFPLFNSKRAEYGGYGVGQDLELEVLRENQEGQEVVIHRFRPRTDGAGS
jgi:hypothetical protein